MADGSLKKQHNFTWWQDLGSPPRIPSYLFKKYKSFERIFGAFSCNIVIRMKTIPFRSYDYGCGIPEDHPFPFLWLRLRHPRRPSLSVLMTMVAASQKTIPLRSYDYGCSIPEDHPFPFLWLWLQHPRRPSLSALMNVVAASQKTIPFCSYDCGCSIPHCAIYWKVLLERRKINSFYIGCMANKTKTRQWKL